MKRDEILAEVTKIICRDRNDTHGNPENSFPLIAQAWTALLQDGGFLAPGKELNGSDVALMMAEFKACRQRFNPNNRDNILDQIGYLAIYQELKDSENVLPVPDYEPLIEESECE